jgi:hypothetical protein
VIYRARRLGSLYKLADERSHLGEECKQLRGLQPHLPKSKVLLLGDALFCEPFSQMEMQH